MSIFPSNPSINEEYSGYRWDGEVWRVIGINLNEDYATASSLFSHESDSTGIHGITSTSDLATKAYADNAATTAAANVVDSAPSTLDTLNELAAALNDDANFATTVTNSLATKQEKASAMVVVDNGANADYPRPTGVGAVYWIGSAQPNNASAYDMWWSG